MLTVRLRAAQNFHENQNFGASVMNTKIAWPLTLLAVCGDCELPVDKFVCVCRKWEGNSMTQLVSVLLFIGIEYHRKLEPFSRAGQLSLLL